MSHVRLLRCLIISLRPRLLYSSHYEKNWLLRKNCFKEHIKEDVARNNRIPCKLFTIAEIVPRKEGAVLMRCWAELIYVALASHGIRAEIHQSGENMRCVFLQDTTQAKPTLTARVVICEQSRLVTALVEYGRNSWTLFMDFRIFALFRRFGLKIMMFILVLLC